VLGFVERDCKAACPPCFCLPKTSSDHFQQLHPQRDRFKYGVFFSFSKVDCNDNYEVNLVLLSPIKDLVVSVTAPYNPQHDVTYVLTFLNVSTLKDWHFNHYYLHNVVFYCCNC
jgi:hypothetical protein